MDPEDWSIDANDAVSLSLYSPGTGKAVASNIHPTYTYSIFGEAERIFGYKELRVDLLFATDDMAPCVHIAWDEKLDRIGDVEAEDVEEALREFVPEEALKTTKEDFVKTLQARSTPFVPPGEVVSTYTLRGHTFSLFRSKLTDARSAALVRNMQVLVPLYIEGGNLLDLDDEPWTLARWTVFFLYDTTAASPVFIGYCTLYDHFLFDTQTPDLARTRLSQFLILPPYQKRGHGSRFYAAIVASHIASPHVRELTVEDPSEPFSDLRDLADIARLRRDPDVKAMTLAAVSAKTWPWDAVRARNKMPARQFARCVEIMLLGALRKTDTRAARAYRLLVKARLYRHNIDVLAQLDRGERVDKLAETYFGLEDEYRRLLRAMEGRRVVEEGGDDDGDDVEDGDDDEEDAGDKGEKRTNKGKGKEEERPKKRVRIAE